MKLTRRKFLEISGNAALAQTMWALPSFSAASLTFDDVEIMTVTDGNLTLPVAFLTDNLPADQIAPILEKYGVQPATYTPPCNVTLLRKGDRTVLFDVGSGPDFMASAGLLPDTLAGIGIDVEDITDVVFTHGHPDHLWGLLDDFDDPLFTNAAYHIGQAEFDYWMNPETVNTIDASRTTFAVGAKRRLEVIEDNIQFFGDTAEFLPGVTAQPSFGHTPGHMAFAVHSGKSAALIVGDAIGNHHLAFERPDLPSGADQDRETGIVTRTKLLDQLATDEMPLIGFHLAGGGVGRAVRQGDAYRFEVEI